MDVPPYILRPGTHHDEPYVAITWKMLIWHSDNYRWLAKHPYFYEMNERTIEIFKSKTTKVTIAGLASDPDYILGFVVYDPVAIHMISVRKGFWRMGIGTALFNSTKQNDGRIVRATHWTKVCEKLKSKNVVDLLYCPSLLNRPRHPSTLPGYEETGPQTWKSMSYD